MIKKIIECDPIVSSIKILPPFIFMKKLDYLYFYNEKLEKLHREALGSTNQTIDESQDDDPRLIDDEL